VTPFVYLILPVAMYARGCCLAEYAFHCCSNIRYRDARGAGNDGVSFNDRVCWVFLNGFDYRTIHRHLRWDANAGFIRAAFVAVFALYVLIVLCFISLLVADSNGEPINLGHTVITILGLSAVFARDFFYLTEYLGMLLRDEGRNVAGEEVGLQQILRVLRGLAPLADHPEADEVHEHKEDDTNRGQGS